MGDRTLLITEAETMSIEEINFTPNISANEYVPRYENNSIGIGFFAGVSDEFLTYGHFQTPEEAALEAGLSAEVPEGTTEVNVFVARGQKYRPYVNVDFMLDRLIEDAYENCGDSVDEWLLHGASADEKNELLHELNAQLEL